MEQLLKCSDVAKILNISKAYSYKLISDGRIPHFNIGRSVRVRYEDVLAFLDKNYKMTIDGIQSMSIDNA